MIFFLQKAKSHSTCSLKASGMAELEELFGPGRAHILHDLQVWQMAGNNSRAFFETPARCNILPMMYSDACHHRVCNFLNTRRNVPS